MKDKKTLAIKKQRIRFALLSKNKTIADNQLASKDGWNVLNQITGFVEGLELPGLDAESGNLYSIITSVPSPWARAYMMNNALIEAFQGLKNDVGLYGINLPSDNVPFFEWDMNNSKFILNADMVSFDSTLNNHIEIHCNSALFTFISSFNAYFNGSNVVESKNYTFKLKKDSRFYVQLQNSK